VWRHSQVDNCTLFYYQIHISQETYLVLIVTEQVSVEATLQICIREVLGSNLGEGTSYPQ
jgi:hypothetical protein